MSGENNDTSPLEFRFGHGAGIVGLDILPSEDNKRGFVTCGADSDIRIWKKGLEDDPTSHELSDSSLTVICGKNGVAYVGTEFHTVEAISLEDGKNLGVKGKFTAPVNHVDLSSNGKWLVAAGGDMKIQVIDLEDSGNLPVVIETHTAPVLSVALDPLNEFLASSGCDGNVVIWSLSSDAKPVHMVKKLEGIFPSSNDITTSPTLCRMSWEAEGKILAIPEENHVALYTRDTWMKLKVLKPRQSKSMIASVTKFSKCGKYLAAGGSDGTIIVWNVEDSSVIVETQHSPELITAIIFTNTDEADIVVADIKGRIIVFANYKQNPASSASESAAPQQQNSISTVNDKKSKDEDETMDLDGDALSLGSSPPRTENDRADAQSDVFDDDDDDLFANVDENEISISKIKAETGFIDDQYVGVKKAMKSNKSGSELSSSDDDDDEVRKPKKKYLPHPPPPPPEIKIVNPVTEPQKPFQPASSPADIDHKFLVWNNTGIIRAYKYENDNEEENEAIDIEFHDAAVHHAIHLRNTMEYRLATLTKEIAVFATEKTRDSGSKLYCHCFGSWDSKKEWSTELPSDEEVIGLAAGDGWLAVATDQNRIRLFTISGAQKQIIEVGGQIVTTSGHEDLLFVTYHNGIGINGSQCMGYSIYRIQPSLKPFPLIPAEPLPLSPKTQLCWIGFSDEGTPVYADSKNVLRILNARYWTPFCAMKDHLQTNKTSDFFWVVGVSELDQRIRAVKCRGMKYPPTLPRPVIMQLDAQIPLCEMEVEKSRLEDKYHRSRMLEALSKKMNKKNYEVDDYKAKAEKEIKESLFSLFVLSSKEDWDARGAEYVDMMPTAHSVQVAVKFASKLRKKGLVDRLTAIGRKKMDEEDMEDEGDDDDFETLKMGVYVYSRLQNRTLNGSAMQDSFFDTSTSQFNTSASISTANRSITVPDEENPFMKKNTEEIRRLLGTSEPSTNRFRKSNPQGASADGSDSGKGLSLIDSWKKPTEKPSDTFAKTPLGGRNPRGKKGGADKEKTNKEKEQSNQKGKKKQTTLLDMGSKSTKTSNSESTSNPPSPAVVDIHEESNDSPGNQEKENSISNNVDEPNPPETPMEDSTNKRSTNQGPPAKQGFMLWFDENKDDLMEEFPDKDSREITKLGMQRYKQLPPEKKKEYLEPKTIQTEEKKRKRSEIEEENGDEAHSTVGNGTIIEKKSKFSSALAGFVRETD